MIKALENPHFKKIWEEVNWEIRHPEAESLEEALEMEKFYYNSYAFAECTQKKVFLYNEIKNILKENNLRILGRPITLEDIMMILPRTFAYWNAYNSIVKVDFVNGNHHHVIGYNLEWQPTKPLHEQNPETWEKISKLMNQK